MTSDRVGKKAARPGVAVTGESYLSARRDIRPVSGRPVEVARPSVIDPREHAIQSHRWGVEGCHLVRYEGRYYAWFTDASAGGRSRVYRLPSEQAGRYFVDDWQVANVLHTPWDQTLAHIWLPDAAARNGICYEAAVIDVAGSGIWLACWDNTAVGENAHVLARFAHVGEALREFAARSDQAADQAGRNATLDMPDLVAGILRYRAAAARAQAARAAIGDIIRRNEAQLRNGRFWPALREAGVDRDNLGAVLVGQDYAWPSGPAVKPPGGRLPDTPATTLAAYSVGGHRFTLSSYQDTSGRNCVAIDRDGHGTAVCDAAVDDEHLVSAGISMATRGRGTAAVYGRAHDSVTELYAVMKDGSRVDWPIHRDPRNQERYFAVIADCDLLADIVAVAPGHRTSLQPSFGVWFSKPPRRRRGPGPRQ